MAQMHVSDVDFVRTYISVASAEDASAALGLTVESIRARASKLRKAGVALPKFTRLHKQVDVPSLNALINDMASY